jgi:hypothetical protein
MQGVADPAEEEEVVLVADQLTPPAEDLSCSVGGEAAVPDEQGQTGVLRPLAPAASSISPAVSVVAISSGSALMFYLNESTT